MFIFGLYEIILNYITITTTFFIFSLYCILIPLILGFWQELIYSFHLGLLWACLLFSFLPEKFYVQDYHDGTLEFYYLSKLTTGNRLNLILFSKLFGYWFLKMIGILCSYPVLSLFYQFELSLITGFTLMLGSFIFLLICSLHSCLTLGAQHSLRARSDGLHYLTTLPALLPLILLCNYIQTESTHFLFLFGLAGFHLSILMAFGSHILKNIISH